MMGVLGVTGKVAKFVDAIKFRTERDSKELQSSWKLGAGH